MAERPIAASPVEAVYVYSPDQLAYRFSGAHPFNQKRLELTTSLLQEAGALAPSAIIPPRVATDKEILLAHDARYVEAVKRASKGGATLGDAAAFGIGTEDTPAFAGMHEASARLVGGTLTAVDAVMSGQARRALHLGGGLHHGFRGKASGFCIYNDSSTAIRYLQQHYGARVLYVDTDAHHGDGVQWTFYDDPGVCTCSIHETGRYLFPGTGSLEEIGAGAGYGFSFNFPLDAFTEDRSFLEVYEAAISELAAHFKPDVLVTQNGVDAHALDPLTHLYGTSTIYKAIPQLARTIADRWCGGRWIAVGGGGYDIWRVVPRAWAFIWYVMTGMPLPEGGLPSQWLARWQPFAPAPLIETWEDPPDLYEAVPRRREIEEKNRRMLTQALYRVRAEKQL